MNYLVSSKDNPIEPRGSIGKQKCGIVFWQKTGFLRHCNAHGFQSIINLIEKTYAPTSVQFDSDSHVCFISFDNDDNKTLYLSLKREKNSNHFYIYGESHTVYTDPDFHIFALNIVNYIAKQIGCKFFVDDATEYIEHKSKEQLKRYILDYENNNKRIL